MTDEARRIYYSVTHWRKMLDDQVVYHRRIMREPRHARFYFNPHRLIFAPVVQSSAARTAYFQAMHRQMSGFGDNRSERSKSLLINGVNYGLMLEGLRQEIHADIDRKFDITFKRIELAHVIINTARRIAEYASATHRTSDHALDAITYALDSIQEMQRIGRIKRETKGDPVRPGRRPRDTLQNFIALENE